MVSNIRILQSSKPLFLAGKVQHECRTLPCALLGLILLFAVFLPISALAQPSLSGTPATATRADEQRAVDVVYFLAGAALGLGMHEGGHVVFDTVFDAGPGVAGIHFGPIPFFAITHRSDLSPRREFTISSAGFWIQEASNEWLLVRRPGLRREHAPVAKGLLAFNVLNSIGYAVVAFAKAGPAERDTRGMAASIGIDERAIGALVLAPALLDGFRYFKPESRWARWGARSAKVASVLLVLKKR
jgi:hypothetical protein